MIRGFLLILLLAGCDSYSQPQPGRYCVKYSDEKVCGRGGCTYVCGTWGITCPVPLKLSSRTDKDGMPVLYCRLEEQ